MIRQDFFVFGLTGKNSKNSNSYFSKISITLSLIYLRQSLYLQKGLMKQTIINKLKQFFACQSVEKAWVFGFYSHGEETEDNDVDILVRFTKNAK